MNDTAENAYYVIRSGGVAVHEQERGLVAVWGDEAVQFLDGLITNDVKKLADGEQMLAAFPNAQGRLLAVVRVLRQGERFLFETEDTTREKLFQNLFRFTFAGEFFVEDLSDRYRYFELFISDLKFEISNVEDLILFEAKTGRGVFVETGSADIFRDGLISSGAVEIGDELYETLRIENGIPRYGVDMDETTIVPELGIDNLISYNKGCYIGQEIIARIHFRGHVAKRLTGLNLSGDIEPGTELLTVDGKNAGRITSVTFSPKLDSVIALGFARYDQLAAGTELFGGEAAAVVADLPFVK
ncbi:MAG: folate-binding protein YgfZ [Chloracidobacterium sp.]|nr:folate-binding protein YgfZ [Chloracidobacterium sp.]